MDDKSTNVVSMPRRFTIIAALLLGMVAVGQGVRAFYGFDMQFNEVHIPIELSWAIAAIAGIVAILAFREGRD